MCEIICIDGFLSMSHLDIVQMLSAYVHVIHTLSGHMHIMRTLFAVVLDMFLPNRQYQCHPYIISSTLYIFYYVQLSFRTLFCTDAHCPCHLHVVDTCTHHLLVIFTTPHIPYYPQLSFHKLSTHMHIVNVICILFRNAYVMYMSSLLPLSVYVHVIYILSGHIRNMCTLSEVVLDMFLPNRQYQCHPYIISSTLYIFYYVQLSFRTLFTQMHIVHVICMLSAHVHIICFSSLTLLVYPIIHNLVSAHCLHTHTLSMSSVHVICMLSAHVHIICLSSLTLLIYPFIHNLISVHIVYTHTHCQYHVYIVYRCICYVHLISTVVICICTCHPHII